MMHRRLAATGKGPCATALDWLTPSRKVLLVLLFFLVINLVCIGRLATLALHARDHNMGKRYDTPSFHRERVDIVDRNDVILATNLTTFSLYADPTKIIEPQLTAQKISSILENIPHKRIFDSIISSKKRFVWIKRNLPPKYIKSIYDLGMPGLFFVKEEKRVYPQGALVSHILGHVNTDGNGTAGVEHYFNERLSIKNDTHNIMPLRLSIDIRIQNAVRRELVKQVDQYKAIGGSAIVLDANTGEALAIVSLPDYDPNNANKSSDNDLFNRATLGVYEIGSIFKVLIAAFALEDKVINLDDTIDISYPIKIGNHYTKDLIPTIGPANIETILKKSSNIGMAKIGLRLGQTRIKYYLEELGFDVASDIELPEKSIPLYPKKWSDAETATISYGYGVAATMMHIAESIATIVNGGYKVNATILKNDEEARKESKRVISATTSNIMRRLLYQVVKSGTGRRANVPGYCVGGKTGTSDRIVEGKYNKNISMTSFAAVFPIYDPKYVVIVIIEEPKAPRATGSVVAAPVAGSIIRRLIALLDIVADEQRCEPYS